MSQRQKQKRPGMSRELTSLYLENQTIPVSLDLFQAKPKFGTKAERWVWRGFKSSARNDDLALHHWAKANEQFTDYFYARYNAKTKPYRYTDEEYTSCIESLDRDWTRAETEYLLSLCEQFDLRFVVIHDRYYTHPDCPREHIAPSRTLEDIKGRYYSICRALTQYRAGQDSRDPDDLPLQATNKLADDLALLKFDKAKELERKTYLEALFKRSKEEIEEEEILVTEARRIEANERRLIHEREMLLQSHALFEEAPSASAASTVKVQFASGFDSVGPSLPGSAAGELTPKIRKGAPDPADGSSARSVKKHKISHGSPSAARVKLSAAASKAQSGQGGHHTADAGNDLLSANSQDTSSTPRKSMSPARAGSGSVLAAVGVKQEHADGSAPQFGKLSFATEEHLVQPAVGQVEASDIGMVAVAQRDTKLGPGVFLRSDKLHPIPKNKLDSVKQFMSQLSLNSPNTIWPRPIMATAAVCDRFDSLQSTIIPLLDCKKVADKLETEVQVLRARKRMLVSDIGEAAAESALSKLPPFDPSKVQPTRTSTPPASEAPSSAGRQHHRKGSNAVSSRKKARE
ncbi:hypothetical protein GQ54DRAFT_297664 [Martensiomyces pterosporus]|nr:hypothetical protein GQ54DRAFT_297664 [Martensiomyces pterosporus]